MANEKRTAGQEAKLDSGPYIGRVVGHLDPNYMGALEVQLLKGQVANNDDVGGQTFKVHYSSPFYGQTPVNGISANQGFAYTQQAYGMWMSPPDVGSRVLVTFVEGAANMGYWIGCIPDNYINLNVPDKIATSFFAGKAQGDGAKSAIAKTSKVVVGEINKKNLVDNKGNDPTKFKKSINEEWMDLLFAQGLEADGTRGLTTSSARRELPSMVFGINTPGPYDKRPGAPKAGYGPGGQSASIPFNRLGGTSFVMDDGDDKILRKGPAGTTKKEFVNHEKGEKGGDYTVPHNELVRIRTRTGHQILLHQTEDLIRIDHGSGNSWIELTSNGKIDVYAKDSISMHTENDLNITADRDINLNAGRNFNVLSKDDIQIETNTDMITYVAGNNQVTTLLDYDLNTIGANKFTAGGTTDILSGGNHTETAPNIHMNGPQAATATAATPLTTHVVPGGPFKTPTDTALTSLHKRLPQHEPWPHHENVDPFAYKPLRTNRLNEAPIPESFDYDNTPDTFKKGV